MIHKKLLTITTNIESNDDSNTHPPPSNPPLSPTYATTMKCVFVKDDLATTKSYLSSSKITTPDVDLECDEEENEEEEEVLTISTFAHKPKLLSKNNQLILRMVSGHISQEHSCDMEGTKDDNISLSLRKQKDFIEMDVCGVVEEVGDTIETFKVGDTVVALNGRFPVHGISEYVITDAERTTLKPLSVDLLQAAAAASAIPSYQIVNQYVKEGDRVLILGSGTTAFSTIQLATNVAGASFISVAYSTDTNMCRSLGAQEVIHCDEQKKWWEIEEFTKNKFDKIIDLVGSIDGDEVKLAMNVLKTGYHGGCLISLRDGPIDDNHSTYPPWFKVIVLCKSKTPESRSMNDLSKVLKLIEERKLNIFGIDQFPFSEEGIKRAFLRLHKNGGVPRKAVVVTTDN